jgi:hypothetical protein
MSRLIQHAAHLEPLTYVCPAVCEEEHDRTHAAPAKRLAVKSTSLLEILGGSQVTMWSERYRQQFDTYVPRHA